MGAVNRPWAARQQTETGREDAALTELARRHRLTISWWWGRDVGVSPPRLRCYICSEVISERAAAAQLPAGAVRDVMAHRALEISRQQITLADSRQEQES